jgi:hypothetical protein
MICKIQELMIDKKYNLYLPWVEAKTKTTVNAARVLDILNPSIRAKK